MPIRAETPHQAVSEIITGHFLQSIGYFAYRSVGTRDWLLIYTRSGRGYFRKDDVTVTSAAGDLTLIAPGTRHDYGTDRSARRWELIWAHFQPRPHWLGLLGWPSSAIGGVMRLAVAGAIGDAIERRLKDAHAFATGGSPHARGLAMTALEEVLLRCDEMNPARGDLIDPRLRAVIEQVGRSLDRAWTIAELAEIAGLSESRFSHLFRDQFGLTPVQYVEQRKMEHAAQLLRTTSLPIKSIARSLGFESQFYFSRRFTMSRGKSPVAFRKSGR